MVSVGLFSSSVPNEHHNFIFIFFPRSHESRPKLTSITDMNMSASPCGGERWQRPRREFFGTKLVVASPTPCLALSGNGQRGGGLCLVGCSQYPSIRCPGHVPAVRIGSARRGRDQLGLANGLWARGGERLVNRLPALVPCRGTSQYRSVSERHLTYSQDFRSTCSL